MPSYSKCTYCAKFLGVGFKSMLVLSIHSLESFYLLCTLEAHTQVSTLLAVLDHHVSIIDKVDAACDIRGQTLEQISHFPTYPCNGLVFTGEVDHNNQ